MLVTAPEYATLTVQDLSEAHGLRLVALSSALQGVGKLIEPHQCCSRKAREGYPQVQSHCDRYPKDRSHGGKPVVLDGVRF
jgi:hypothetical protein